MSGEWCCSGFFIFSLRVLCLAHFHWWTGGCCVCSGGMVHRAGQLTACCGFDSLAFRENCEVVQLVGIDQYGFFLIISN